MTLIKNNIVVKLEPTKGSDVGSKINLQVEEDMIRLFMHDCDSHICWRFKSGVDSYKKLERIRTMLDILEGEMNEYQRNKKL
ncbi:MAG: hypothetical protein AABY15_02285 [Nanoarchaeota archaeon]